MPRIRFYTRISPKTKELLDSLPDRTGSIALELGLLSVIYPELREQVASHCSKSQKKALREVGLL